MQPFAIEKAVYRRREKAVSRWCKLRCEIASILREGNRTGIAASFQRFKRDGGVQGEEGFYEREILQQTVCTHLTDQYTSEDVARTKLPCYIPVRLFIPLRETFAAITQLKFEVTLFSVLSSERKEDKRFISGGLLAKGRIKVWKLGKTWRQEGED